MRPATCDFRLLIGGRLRHSSEQLNVVNPATGDVFAQCPRTTPELLEEAVARAREAFGPWSHRPWDERAAVLLRIADAVEARIEEIANLVTLEQGKPIAQSRMEVDRAAAMCRGLARFEQGVDVIQDDAAQRVEVHRKPLGVVAAIVPWNASARRPRWSNSRRSRTWSSSRQAPAIWSSNASLKRWRSSVGSRCAFPTSWASPQSSAPRISSARCHDAPR